MTLDDPKPVIPQVKPALIQTESKKPTDDVKKFESQRNDSMQNNHHHVPIIIAIYLLRILTIHIIDTDITITEIDLEVDRVLDDLEINSLFSFTHILIGVMKLPKHMQKNCSPL